MSEVNSSIPITNDGSAILQQIIEIQQQKEETISQWNLQQRFQVEETCAFIREMKASRVALQFPDSLLPFASELSRMISFGSQCKCYILGDTSFGSCCVDEVAGEHAEVECIIKYGESCCSPTRRVPVRYVFGKSKLDTEKLVQALLNTEAFAEKKTEETKSINIVVLYEQWYEYAVKEIQQLIQSQKQRQPDNINNYIVATVQLERRNYSPSQRKNVNSSGCSQSSCCQSSSTSTSACCQSSSNSDNLSSETTSCCQVSDDIDACCNNSTSCCSNQSNTQSVISSISTSATSATSLSTLLQSLSLSSSSSTKDQTTYAINGYTFTLPSSISISDCCIVWIGESDRVGLTNIMLNYNNSTFYTFNPNTNQLLYNNRSVNRILSRRFFLMEKVKNAEIIGIIVGTLAVENYLDVIRHVKKLIHSVGKKSYLFLIGKINDPKLCNFSEIDMYVMIACPYGVMTDTTGYFKEVVTPYELELALT